jgi:hypothetical protein
MASKGNTHTSERTYAGDPAASRATPENRTRNILTINFYKSQTLDLEKISKSNFLRT